MRKTSWRRRGAAVVLSASALLIANTAPTGAVAIPPETGAGAATGGFTTFGAGDPGLPPVGLLCLPVDKANTPGNTHSSVLEIWGIGTYTATDLSNPPLVRAIYTGPAHAVFTTSQTYYFNPLGTFVDSSCLTPAIPPLTGIAGTLEIDHITGNPFYQGGSVDCGPAAAQYGRNAAELGLIIAVSASCTVTDTLLGTGPYTSTGVTITFEAAQQPCLPIDGLPCVLVPVGTDFFAGTEWVGTYTQT